ncbi:MULTISPECIES: DUF262 domain-containing protein [Chryseobacterium]|uniref:GmrSD restriction endonucleases N-terminal domain-containing protein n=1 Tax=Chryseobacterium piscium TaxID=333702 RepID=A0A3D9BRX9_9FLAO|nr:MULTISPECIES: DUF262 domain-containing protein [Chryseobacterium]REC40913.1 hypothetical protein DRF69_16795 [Chryseobacterium sp. 5_R23647]REC56279.1 hypothetical protein DRF62_04225 [Chryseobacterium piscium]
MSNNPTSKLLTFQSLINDCQYEVVLPIIQRDYAQGREGLEELRSNFLDSLHSAVTTGEKLELDFVYGDVRKGVFKPLDGQQRLTTLFLLHWYAAIKNPSITDKENILTKFTYETRTSSREFCEELVDKGIVYDESKTISKLIVDSSWFFLSWKRDPTIQSMLTMLDAIHEKFKNENENLWEELNNISFHFIELQNFGLSDDLYIKMNARGKPLTDFENFKAKFEQYIKQNKWEDGLDLKNTFAHKIDTVWTDLFWKHRNVNSKIDDKILKFFANIAISNYAENLKIYEDKEEFLLVKKELLEKSKGKTITDEAVERERIEQRIAKLLNNPKALKPEDFNSKELFLSLKNSLNLYSNQVNSYDKIYPDVNLWNSITEKTSLFDYIVQLEKATTYKQAVLFCAQTKFLTAQNLKPLDIYKFSNWMRVIRNIVENSTIDSATTFIGAINLIFELSVGSQYIHEFLQTNKIDSRFAEKQVEEEIIKANLIKLNSQWQTQIFKIEDDSFLKGEIILLLELSSINEKFEYEKFKFLSDEFVKVFEAKDDLLRRSLLAMDHYAVWDGYTTSLEAHRYTLLHTDNEWKDAIRKKYEKFVSAITKLLTHTHQTEGDRSMKLNLVLENYVPNNDYRDVFIQYKKSLSNSYYKRFCYNENSSNLYILEKTKVVGNNYKKIKLKI